MIDTSPAALMAKLTDDANNLDAAGRELGKAISEAATARLNYERAFHSAVLAIHDAYKAKGERPPAEDIRKAIAHKDVPNNVYAAHLTADAKVDSLKSWLNALRAAANARQSVLGALRDEARVAA